MRYRYGNKLSAFLLTQGFPMTKVSITSTDRATVTGYGLPDGYELLKMRKIANRNGCILYNSWKFSRS
jgi:hypothetical protein